jgi:uncharacterized protein YbcI
MAEPQNRSGTVAAAISDGLVHLHKEYYGKGPTKTKTYLVNDTVICMLQGGFTVVERTLIDDGRSEAVHDVRRVFQNTMQDRFTEVVEKATGRRVVAYLSQVHSDPDLALEVFVLEPSSEPLLDEHEAHIEEKS